MPTPSDVRHARIAVVHPLIESIRGGEKVFFDVARALPEADLFTLHYRPGILPDDIAARLQTSFLQRPGIRRLPFRTYLPLLPAAVGSLPTDKYDVVVSTSSGWAHGAPKGPGATHISYMFTPPRYLWHEAAPNRLGRALGGPLELLLRRLRKWDIAAAQRVDRFIVLSEITRGRVRKHYGRESEIVYPPVDIERWFNLDVPRGDHVVAAGELVPYKRFDLAIEACRLAGLPLVIVGDGPQRKLLERQAARGDVRFLGRADDATFAAAVAGARVFIHPGVEDFGIITVEALAAGVPVVGSVEGGTGEIVTPGTGLLVEDPSAEAFAAALTTAVQTDFHVDVLRARARHFAPARFRSAIVAAVDDALGEMEERRL